MLDSKKEVMKHGKKVVKELEKALENLIDLAAESLKANPTLTAELGRPTRVIKDAVDQIEGLLEEHLI